jgi:hypothetical protein
MKYCHVQKLRYGTGLRHKMKEKLNKGRNEETRKNKYGIRTDVFK